MTSSATARRPARRRARRALAAVVALPFFAGSANAASAVPSPDPVIAAVSQDGPPLSPIVVPQPTERAGGYVAKVLQSSVARGRPRPDARRIGIATDRTDHLDQGTRLMVLAARYDGEGRPWLRVQLPIRPNGTSGWMRAGDAVVLRTPWGVRVRLRRRELSVYRSGRLARRVSVVVGAPATPTPRGLFAVYEVAPQRDPTGFTGPWALNLTGFSTVLENFGSGPGKVAIHGRDGASLLDPLGTARSHGCVRVDNATVVWLERHLANGTPIRITAG